jgi:hypothetical protein
MGMGSAMPATKALSPEDLARIPEAHPSKPTMKTSGRCRRSLERARLPAQRTEGRACWAAVLRQAGESAFSGPQVSGAFVPFGLTRPPPCPELAGGWPFLNPELAGTRPLTCGTFTSENPVLPISCLG